MKSRECGSKNMGLIWDLDLVICSGARHVLSRLSFVWTNRDLNLQDGSHAPMESK